MKKRMLELYGQYCINCFRKNEEPKASFRDYSYIHFGKEAYWEVFKESYQGKYL